MIVGIDMIGGICIIGMIGGICIIGGICMIGMIGGICMIGGIKKLGRGGLTGWSDLNQPVKPVVTVRGFFWADIYYS